MSRKIGKEYQIMTTYRTVAAVTMILLTVVCSGGARAARFIPLGDLPGAGNGNAALGVSDSGEVVVGCRDTNEGKEAFYWTEATGIVNLGDLPGGLFRSVAYDVSADGSVIVGHAASSESTDVPVRWTAATGFVPLTGAVSSQGWATAVTPDGSVAVGYYQNPDDHREAFRWTETTGVVGLGDLAGDPFWSSAQGVSDDGSVVVGFSRPASTGVQEAFRWTESQGMVSLGFLQEPNATEYYTYAHAVSGDGAVVVGRASVTDGSEGFRWTEETGMRSVGRIPGDRVFCELFDVNGDGTVAVGRTKGAVIWDEANGLRKLKGVLENDYGLDLTGWQLDAAHAITLDGRVIVGGGVSPDRKSHAFVVELWEALTLLEVTIDIRPGNEANPVCSASRGALPVAILGADDLGVEDIDLGSLLLEGASPRPRGNSGRTGSFLDTNGDSFLDLIVHFDMADLLVDPGAAEFTLTGLLNDGTEIAGSDSVWMVPGSGQRPFAQAASEFSALGTGHVPEPAALSLLALGGLPVLRRRRRH